MEITSAENEKQPSATLPLLSRIDRLETVMRRLEMKQISASSSGCSSNANTAFSPSSGLTSEHQQLPLGLDLDMALKETSFKGSLLERIKALENRLFQLKLRVESDKMEERSRRDQLASSCSFPVFMMNQTSIAYKKLVTPNATLITSNIQSQAKEEDVTSCMDDEEKFKQQKQKMNKTTKKLKSKSETGDHQKRGRKKKKKKVMREAEREKLKSVNWAPHFRMLGC